MMVFSNKLMDLYPGGSEAVFFHWMLGQAPLDGDRVVMFLGRSSPAGWALRSVARLLRRLEPFTSRGPQPVPLRASWLPNPAKRLQQPGHAA